MKYLLLLTSAIVLTVLSCTKTKSVSTQPPPSPPQLLEDNGCIERFIIPVTAHAIKDDQIIIADNLFLNSGIDNSKYRYFRYMHDTLLFQNNTSADEKMVSVDQYLNGLRIFAYDLNFIFWNDAYHDRSGHKPNGTNLDNVSHLTLGQLRKLFVDDLEKFDNSGNQYKDSCFKAEFGYFNLNLGSNDTTEKLVKTWKVTLKNSVYPVEYPIALYQDIDGKLISFSDGIFSGR
jgi:hypothetical protein